MADEIIRKETLFRGWFDLLMLRVRLGGEEVDRPIVEHPSGSAVLAFDPERKVALMVKQSRPPRLYLGAEPMLEALAGALDGDDPETCARREALEEGGVKLGELEHVAHVWPAAATSTEQIDCFLAPYAASDRVAPGGGLDEEDEHLRVKEVPLAELGRMARGGELEEVATLILVQALQLRRPELFAD